ncbi:MAG: DUF1653 domain-containing protein [Salinibacterium sp.]|nr:DUF1653 domain-containing protein [Salinibacterium sp.]
MLESDATPGRYQHFKGAIYVVTGVALHSETEEPHVIYHREGSTELWIRPAAMWSERVARGDYDGPRFTPLP